MAAGDGLGPQFITRLRVHIVVRRERTWLIPVRFCAWRQGCMALGINDNFAWRWRQQVQPYGIRGVLPHPCVELGSRFRIQHHDPKPVECCVPIVAQFDMVDFRKQVFGDIFLYRNFRTIDVLVVYAI